MSGFDYDLFVIGGGSGGVRAARVAASLGKKTGIAEQSRFGGTCVIRGCVPKKLLSYAAGFSKQFEDAAGYGWHIGKTEFDWTALVKAKENEITRLEGLYRKGLDGMGAEMFDSRAVLVGPNTVRLQSDGRQFGAEKIIIAVGGVPNPMAPLSGHEHCILSDDIFDLEKFPEQLVIFGSGYIAVEFASVFAGLGSDVTLVYRADQILRGFDDDLRAHLQDELTKQGINFKPQNVIEEVTLEKGGARNVRLSDGTKIAADQVLLATGRNPNTDGLGLEAAGVNTDARGFVTVDEFSKTSNPAVFALGDVTNRVALTPVAIHEAMSFIDSEYHGKPTKPDHELIATAVFCSPEIGTIGLSEEAAAKQFEQLSVFKTAFRPMKFILPGRDSKMMMKIIVDAKTDRVLGVHIIGPDAAEMIQALAIAVKMGATKADFDRTMAVHPTAAEELVTLYQPSYRVKNGERMG